MKHFFTFLTLFLTLAATGQSFSDDFEAYPKDGFIAGNNPKWTTWDKMPNSATDAKVSEEFAKSGKQSAKIAGNSPTAGGPIDLVLPFGARYTKGTFNYKMSMYIPTGKNAYFNFQGTTTVGGTYSMDANFDGGKFNFTKTSVPVLDGIIPHDKWFELQFDINLSSNVWKVLIDGICVGAFSNPTNSIASIDLYPLSDQTVFYVDDVSYNYISTETIFVNDGGLSAVNWPKGKLSGISGVPSTTFRNNGTTKVTSLDVDVTTNGVVNPLSFTGLNLAKAQTLLINLPQYSMLNGQNSISVAISKINGVATDQETCNNIGSFSINAIKPAKNRAVLVEEGTGTWCQYCPRGAVFMDRYNYYYEDLFIPIAVHNGNNDPMRVLEYDQFVAFPGYPNCRVNRGSVVDPSGAEAPFLAEIVKPALASIKPIATYNTSTKKLDVKADIEFLADATGEYYVTFVISEDGVRGTSAGYAQSNAFANSALGVMGGFELLPNPVPANKMVYDHVARAVTGLKNNGTNAFDGTYKKGDKITISSEFVIADTWKLDSMHLIPILLEGANKYINAATANISDIAVIVGNEDITLSADKVKVYPNPADDYTMIAINMQSPGEVSLELMDISGKLISKKSYGVLSGELELPVNLLMLNSGMYLAKINTPSGSRIEKISVR